VYKHCEREGEDGSLAERVQVVTSLEELADASFLVEAVVEDPDHKTALLEELTDHVDGDAVLSTTTSSLSITELGRAIGHADRFVGLHPFNPVPRMKLVELVFPEEATATVRERSRALCEALGKTVGVQDRPRSGMNGSCCDVNTTGRPSIYVSNISEPGLLVQGNCLWTPMKGCTGDRLKYLDLANAMKVQLGGWSWGAQFVDLNNDGIPEDNEPGIAGVRLLIRGTGIRGNTVNRFIYTGSDGTYMFTGLPPDLATYTITETQPPQFRDGKDRVGSVGGVAAANRVFAIADEPPMIVDSPGAIDLSVKRAPLGGAIRFHNVHFAYRSDANAPALNGVTFEAQPGQKIALVGPSGAGKTTILGILLRFYDADHGHVEIDGRDLREVTIRSLRSNMALVTQEPLLFDETIADNIALGRPGASRSEIAAAARAAAADAFISDLSEGYDTRAGEGGLRLSGGQRQRIAIARAMIRNAPILLMDEATSSLDSESERQVQNALATLMKNRTTIVIAHRLSTVRDADCIHVLDKGVVVESGTHTELVTKGGLYARLYRHNLEERDDNSAVAVVA